MSSDSDDESYIIEAERKSKQNYLTEEILDNNYDPDLFMNFCASLKEADIDAWSFEELQECVHKFKMTYRRGQTLKEIEATQSKEKKTKDNTEPKALHEPSVVKTKASFEPVPSEISPRPSSSVAKTEPPEVKKKAPFDPVPSVINPLVNSPAVKTPVKDDNLESIDSTNKDLPKETPSTEKNVVARSNTSVLDPRSSSPINEDIKTEKILRSATSVLTSDRSPIEEDKTPILAEENKEILIKDQKFTVKCISAEDNELSRAENLTFEILEPELVRGGFFSADYHLYPVKIPAVRWECKRRFNQFLWLRETLYITLPGNFIPPLPSDKPGGSKEEFVQKRKKFLLKFTASLSRNKFLLRTSLVENFFKIPDYKDFLLFQKMLKKKVKKPENLDQVTTNDGTAYCDISYQGPRAEKLLDYTLACEAIENKLKRQASNIINDIKAMQITLTSLSETARQLEEAQSILPYASQLKQLYGNISSTFTALSSQEGQRWNLFQEYYNFYFKYSYLEKITLKELLKERDSAFNEYTKAESKQKNLEKARSMFGYLNCKNLEEAEGTIKKDALLMSTNFIEYAHEKIKIATELHGIWSKLADSIINI
jgi:PX domain